MPKHLFRFALPNEKDNLATFTNAYVTEYHELFLATFGNGRYSIYRVVDSLKSIIHPKFISGNVKDK